MKPKTIVRDTTLDPQLVWKGKDEQDADDLKVPAVPIYIAESEGRRTEQQPFEASSFRALIGASPWMT